MGAVHVRQSIREIATQPVILWTLLGGKPKWLPLNLGFNDVMRTAPILRSLIGCTYRDISDSRLQSISRPVFTGLSSLDAL